jgi:hypothetical protein
MRLHHSPLITPFYKNLVRQPTRVPHLAHNLIWSLRRLIRTMPRSCSKRPGN